MSCSDKENASSDSNKLEITRNSRLPEQEPYEVERASNSKTQGNSSSKKSSFIKLDPLKNWRQWNDDRIELSKYLSRSLEKEPDRLEMMKVDNKYFKFTDKDLIDKAFNFVKFDKDRGDPKFWAIPNYIYDKKTCLPVNCPTKEYFDRTSPSANLPPAMQYVEVPNEIKIEMGSGEYRAEPRSKSHSCDYLKERKNQLKENIDLIEPFRPDLNDLFIRGYSIRKQKTEPVTKKRGSLKRPLFVVEHFKWSRTGGNKCRKRKRSSDISKRRCKGDSKFEKEIKRDKCEIVIRIDGKTYDSRVSVPFTYQIEDDIRFSSCWTNELNKKELLLENVGNLTLRFWWEKITTFETLSRRVKRFHFPTGRHVISPGQKIGFPLYFFTREPGVFVETWALQSVPKIHPNQVVQMDLVGSSVKRGTSSMHLSYIDKYVGITRKNDRDLNLNGEEGISFAVECPEQNNDYRLLFNEEEIFDSKNQEQIYRNSLMKVLNEVNTQVSTGKSWSYSIFDLKRDVLDSPLALEEKRNLLKTINQSSKYSHRKNRCISERIRNEQFTGVYQILCCALNHIEEDSDNIKATLKILDLSQGESDFKHSPTFDSKDSMLNKSVVIPREVGESYSEKNDLQILSKLSDDTSKGHKSSTNRSNEFVKRSRPTSIESEQKRSDSVFRGSANIPGEIETSDVHDREFSSVKKRVSTDSRADGREVHELTDRNLSIQMLENEKDKYEMMIRKRTRQRLCNAASQIQNLMESYSLIRNRRIPSNGKKNK